MLEARLRDRIARTAALSWIVAVAATAASLGCASSAPRFDATRARAHIDVLAGAIGRRPAGSPASERARAYLAETLQRYGFDVRTQHADAVHAADGTTAQVANLIATRAGASLDAVGLVAHYDTRAWSPGAGDDGFGVATVLEAARVLAERPSPRYSLMVVLTDGEEDGLMGARALVQDDEIRRRLRTYLNVEAIGTTGPVPLFETAAGTGPALRAWAASPHPRGGSYMLSIYKALPNDTDATVLQTLGLYGLNFAAVGNSHVYHTDRDLPDRVSSSALARTGENTIAIVEALDGGSLDATDESSIYGSVLDRLAFVLGSGAARVLSAGAVLLGLVAFIAVTTHLRRAAGWRAIVVTAVWTTAATVLATVVLVASVWLLRMARSELHPWYSAPSRLFIFMAIAVAGVTWMTSQAARAARTGWRPVGTPGAVWLVALPVWLSLVAAAAVWADAAAYLVAIPLACAGVVVPLALQSELASRTAALVVALVTWAVLAPDAWTLLQFAVATFGRLPVVTPTWLLPVLVVVFSLVLWPPVVAVAIGRPRTRRARRVVTVGVCAALLGMGASVAVAPAYTTDQPLRRSALHVDDRVTGRAFWRLAGNEHDVDVPGGPAVSWHPIHDADPWPLRGAFVFGAEDEPPVADPPAQVSGRVPARSDTSADIEIVMGPHHADRLTAVIILPDGLTPTSSTLVGSTSGRRWRARYVNVPREGLVWRATIPVDGTIPEIRAEVWLSRPELPGAVAPRLTPPWLPDDRATWTTEAVTVLPVTFGWSS